MCIRDRIDATPTSTSKGNYTHFMEKEIYEQPDALGNTINGRLCEHDVLDNIFGMWSSDAFKNVKIIDIINSMRDAGINVAANYIFGLPEETKESLEFTYNFAEETNTEMVNFYSAMAYPGSPLYLESKKNNVLLPKTYSGYSQHSYDTQNLPSKHLSLSLIHI